MESAARCTLYHPAFSLSMVIPTKMSAKPVGKLLDKWVKEHRKRFPEASGAGFRLELEGACLPLSTAIGEVAPGARLVVVEEAGTSVSDKESSASDKGASDKESSASTSGAGVAAAAKGGRRVPGGVRDCDEVGDFARAPPDIEIDEIFATRRVLRIAERDCGARLGCPTSGPCRVSHVRRGRGSTPFPGLDPLVHVRFGVASPTYADDDVGELVSVVCPGVDERGLDVSSQR